MIAAVRQGKNYSNTVLVILAGGQARRMNGVNKLLQKFDDQIQLVKIFQHFKNDVMQIWVNSHRDHSIYKQLVSEIYCYPDDDVGFYGPLMGIKSAWTHFSAEYILFVPCDITFIPNDVAKSLHHALIQNPLAEVAYVEINGKALYPFCLMKPSALKIICTHLKQRQRSLKHCFTDLNAQSVAFENHNLCFHSINTLDELQRHQQVTSLSI